MGLQPVACHVILHDLWPDTIKTTWWFRPVIANLGYAYPQVYEPGHLGVCKKKLNNGRKRHICQRYKTRYSYKSKGVKLNECYDKWQSLYEGYNLWK